MSNVATVSRPEYRAQNLPPGAKYCPGSLARKDAPTEGSKTQKRKAHVEALRAANKWDSFGTKEGPPTNKLSSKK